MSQSISLDFSNQRIALREALVARGFSDDGEELRGNVKWVTSEGQDKISAVKIRLGHTFPFSPPDVYLDSENLSLDTLVPTFHIETTGALCLYDRDTVFGPETWGNADQLLGQISGWCNLAEAGWPGDNDCDLERYLPNGKSFVLYDSSELSEITGIVAIRRDAAIYRVLANPKAFPTFGRSLHEPRRAWIGDLGFISSPVSEWEDLLPRLGPLGHRVERCIRDGNLELLLLRYQRGDSVGVLVVRAFPTSLGIHLESCESADTSIPTRALRSNMYSDLFRNERIAIVGCGAIGSFVADLLFRSGAREITLIDPQRLKPGNIVRHLAGDSEVGTYKVEGVFKCLSKFGLPVDCIKLEKSAIIQPHDALKLMTEHTIVIDATADSRTTGLLITLAGSVNGMFLSVCLQREGGIARVDRWPLGGGEQHLPPLNYLAFQEVHEHGCGEIVSMTPPHSVLIAASLAIRVILDRLAGGRTLPPTLVEVIRGQIDRGYEEIGLVMSSDFVVGA